MKQQSKSDEVSADGLRTEAIRSLCQGPAFLQRPYEIGVPKATLQAFELDDEELFVNLLRRGLDLMTDAPHKGAMLWALGSYAEHDTLTARRNDYLKGRGISYRTLVRHEQEGAAQLAALIMKIKEREVADEPSSPANLQYLQQRVSDLETLVSALSGFAYEVLDMLDENRPLDPQAIRKAMTFTNRQPDDHWTEFYQEAQVRVVGRAVNSQLTSLDAQRAATSSSSESPRDQD